MSITVLSSDSRISILLKLEKDKRMFLCPEFILNDSIHQITGKVG